MRQRIWWICTQGNFCWEITGIYWTEYPCTQGFKENRWSTWPATSCNLAKNQNMVCPTRGHPVITKRRIPDEEVKGAEAEILTSLDRPSTSNRSFRKSSSNKIVIIMIITPRDSHIASTTAAYPANTFPIIISENDWQCVILPILFSDKIPNHEMYGHTVSFSPQTHQHAQNHPSKYCQTLERVSL